jgi:hypothetical protein
MFNYYFDQNRDGHLATISMFEAIGRGEYEGYTSKYVLTELQDAQEPKQSSMINLINKYNLITLDSSKQINQLAKLYIDKTVIPQKYRLDALHIACATVNNLDIILSFNYKHINKLKTKKMTDIINKSNGYQEMIIALQWSY